MWHIFYTIIWNVYEYLHVYVYFYYRNDATIYDMFQY